MPTVSNTSPILNLAIINRLNLLQQQFVELFIPPAVQQELKPASEFPGANSIQQALQAGWLQVVELKDVKLAQTLMLELDQGEAATIALALELGLRQILMDERDGRAKAKALGLNPVGVLGVLLRAKRDGNIDSIETEIQTLRREAGFFIADDLYTALLIEAGES